MSTTNNNTASFTVENLVAKYREYISKHCSYSGNACEGNNGKMIDVFAPKSPDANADEQLLVTLYSCVAGCEADKNVLTALSMYDEKYQKEALAEEEFVFLCNNFKELVAYEFSHRTEWGWKSAYKANEDVEYLPHRSHHTHTHIARTSLQFEIIKLLPKPEVGQTIFITDSGYCDVAMLFPECIIKGYTTHNHFDDDNETWALGQIRLYAAGIKSEILPTQKNGLTPEYMSDVDYAIWGMSRYSSFSFYEGVEMLLQHMKPNGKIFISMERNDAAGGGKTLQLRKKLVEGHLVDSIFSFEEEDEFLNISRKTIFISASKSTHHTVRMQMIPGDMLEIPSDMLDANIFWPGFYLANKPENGIPLSEIASYDKMLSVNNILKDEDVTVDAIKDELIISDRARKLLNMFSVATPADMATNYKEANLCHANLKESGNSIFEAKGGWIKIITKPCVLLYGRGEKFVVGYVDNIPKQKLVTLLDPNPCLEPKEGITTLEIVPCLKPNEGIDVRYIAALLLMPEIKEQILSICEGDVDDMIFPMVMDKIIIPNHSEKERLSFLLEANYNALISSRKEMSRKHEHYIKAVRMRKHALTQSLSSVKSMFNALNNYRNLHNGKIADNEQISRVKGTTVREAFDFINKNIKDLMPALEHVADVEYTFSNPEWIDPERFIEDYISKKENGWLNFKPSVTWDKGHNQAKIDLKDPSTGQNILKKGDAVDMLLFPIDALERVFNNIVSNAQAHGFTDSTRKNYELRFSWHTDGIALIVEIENNGTAIPSDRDTASLLEYGVSSALHQNGHNGIGCNEIDDIMRRYDGKIEIVSSPEKRFTVKYVLTFNRSNIVKSYNL